MVLSCMTSVLWSACSRFTSECRDSCPFSDLRCQKMLLSLINCPSFIYLNWGHFGISSVSKPPFIYIDGEVMLNIDGPCFPWKKNWGNSYQRNGKKKTWRSGDVSRKSHGVPRMKALRINGLLQGETFLWQFFYCTVGESVLAVSQKKGMYCW